MAKVIKLVVVLVMALALSACSDSDGGGSSGGSGRSCYDIAGPYVYDNGATASIRPDCTFSYSGPDGNARGRVLNYSDTAATIDIVIVSGPAKGACGTFTMGVNGNEVAAKMDARQCY